VVRLHAVVGYDGTPPASSRALDAAVRLLRGREGSIEVSYVAHVPGLDLRTLHFMGRLPIPSGQRTSA